MEEIHESFWRETANQLCSYKYFWAFKNGRVFVSVATKTSPLRFMVLPQMRGTTMEMDFNPQAIESDEVEAKQKVVDWLNS